MIADALKILGRHQQIHRLLAAAGRAAQRVDDVALHPQKQRVHLVVLCNDLVRLGHILVNERLQAAKQHLAGLRRHLPQIERAHARLAAEHQRQLADVRRVVADALHVGDHLQRGGHAPQVAGHRLLGEQQLHAQALHQLFLLVDLLVTGDNLLRPAHVVRLQRAHRIQNRPLDHLAHADDLAMQPLKLLVIPLSHASSFGACRFTAFSRSAP